MQITTTTVRQILTRTTGFLRTVSSHSLQPYCGCALGNSFCGSGCYVQHNFYLTRGRPWGSFVEARTNAAIAYRQRYNSERNWARRQRVSRSGSASDSSQPGRFGVFLSSSTEPFQPLENKLRVTRSVLEEMVSLPPDLLIIQSHTYHVADYLDLYPTLAARTELRFHISIESDRDELPGLPRPASSVADRIAAARTLRTAGLRVVATVAPLVPIQDPRRFFEQLCTAVDAVVIDHFIEGDGSRNGARTRGTPLPVIMETVHPGSSSIEYRHEIVDIAKSYFPGRVGVSIDGFAGRMLEVATQTPA